MSLDITKLGSHFIVGLEGVSLSEKEKDLLSELNPAGIILFAKNIALDSPQWREKLSNLINEAKHFSKQKHFFISIDHEGGRVHRFGKLTSHFPAASTWKHKSKSVGDIMGKELVALGINLNFAPVLDVFSDSANKVIGDRAFSSSPDDISQFAIEFTQAMESHGVMSCAKHFPGHGATIADSHYELPYLDAPIELLNERELLPFQKYFIEFPHLVMSAHVLYKALDAQNPATLSDIILNKLLRNQLGFTGAVISDDLEMQALGNYSLEEKAVKALKAGVDILLEAYPKQSLALEQAKLMAIGTLKALESNVLDESILDISLKRINNLREHGLNILEKSKLSPSNLQESL